MIKSNPFVSYYVNQAGSGIAGYSGVRYQRGHGFFGRLLSGAVMPILKYLGKKALNTGVNIGSDLLQGDDIKISMKKRLKNTGLDIAEDALNRVRNFKQSGSGRRKKRRRISNKKGVKRRKPSLLQLRALAEGRKSRKKRRNIKRNKNSKLILFE